MTKYITIHHTYTDEDTKAILKQLEKTLLNDDEEAIEEFTPIHDIFTPTNFQEFIGQNKVKEAVCIMVDAALKEKRSLPNILIDGPFGLGKTVLASLIMERAKLKPKIIDGASIVAKAMPSGTVIIDEIHNVPPDVCDSLNILLDQGRVSIIGCTTNVGALPAAFKSRFRSVHLEPYTVEELTTILDRVTHRKGVAAPRQTLEKIAKRSRFTARVGINYLSTVFDYMSVRNEKSLTESTLNDAFTNLGLDEYGFLPRDWQYLRALNTERPVGLQYLEAVLNIDKTTIEEEIEPFLMRKGLVDRTPRGRILIKPA